jgi:hypothetical protein
LRAKSLNQGINIGVIRRQGIFQREGVFHGFNDSKAL